MPMTTSADGTAIHYLVEGSGEVPLILLHGLGDGVECWAPQVEAFRDRCRILMVDVRGHGRSDKQAPDYSIESMAADVRAAAAAADFDHAHVVGLSMGGGVAFALALATPDLVDSLVIVNSGPTAKVGGWKGKAIIGVRKLLARWMSPSKAAPMVAKRLFPDPDQVELRAEAVRRLGDNDPAAYRQSLFALARFDRELESRTLDVPTLFVHSEHDYTPLAWRQPYVDAMPNARLVQVDGAHHAVTAERPDAFNQILADHLAKVASTAA